MNKTTDSPTTSSPDAGEEDQPHADAALAAMQAGLGIVIADRLELGLGQGAIKLRVHTSSDARSFERGVATTYLGPDQMREMADVLHAAADAVEAE